MNTATLREQFVSNIRSLSSERSTEREINTRAANLSPKSLDKENRTVGVIATTEDPALVWDWQSGRVILEVLLMSGAITESQTPLLRDHNQYSVTSICGSYTDSKAVADRLEGTITVGKDLDDVVEGIWKRIEQGHLRRVSVGYDYSREDYVTIPAGETSSVGGRSFTAPKERDLRVVKKWSLRELSLVVIPADARAQLKAQQQDRRGTASQGAANSESESVPSKNATSANAISAEVEMKKFLRFLHKNGLASSVTNETEALDWARNGNLTSAQIAELTALCKEDGTEFDAATATAKRSEPSTTGTREGAGQAAPSATGTESQQRGVSTETGDVQSQVQAALAAERSRITAIRALGAEHDIEREVVDRCEMENLTIDQARGEFLTALRSQRQSGAPAIHVRSGMSGAQGVRILQAAMLAKEGFTPDSAVLLAPATGSLARRRDLSIDWAIGCPSQGQRRNELEAAFEAVHQRGLAGASMLRVAQEMIEMETGQRAPYNNDDIIERAFSSANFSAVFAATVHMALWAGYASTAATWARFCQVVDVPDFRDNTDAMLGEVGRLKRQSKNAPGKATLLNMTDPVLAKMAADRYAGMLQITEQSFINDSFGALGQTPFKLGQAVQAIIADLVYAQLLSTANLSDGRPRFNATDGNLILTGTADVNGLTTLEVQLRAKKVGDRRIALGKTVIVAGLTLGPKFRVLSGTSQLVTVDNPFAGTFETVEDTAIDIGVSDPYTDPETAIAGRPQSYFGLTADGNSITVAFRQGTNRGPVTRTKTLDGGEWGKAWDVYVDVGAAFLRRTGAVEVRL